MQGRTLYDKPENGTMAKDYLIFKNILILVYGNREK
jgi:hypothetical protein